VVVALDIEVMMHTEAGQDLSIGFEGLSLGPQDPGGPPATVHVESIAGM